jgi:hypothetical protein
LTESAGAAVDDSKCTSVIAVDHTFLVVNSRAPSKIYFVGRSTICALWVQPEHFSALVCAFAQQAGNRDDLLSQ